MKTTHRPPVRRFFADRQSRACDSTSQALLFLCLSPRHGQKSNIQGGKLLLEMLAGVPVRASENFLVFAGVPQGPRKTVWRLRESRKSLEKLFGVCGSSARAISSILTLAEVPQTPLSSFSCLRKFRKCSGELFGVCGSSASASGNALAFATPLQGKHFQNDLPS